VLLIREISIRRRKAIKELSCIYLFPLVCVTPGLSQRAQRDKGGLPKYDLYSENENQRSER
jgi:hypothetical protein